jgi:hypothetical protein
MFSIFHRFFRPKKQYYWVTKDQDFPVEFISIAGEAGGARFAEVLYEGKTSYVPYEELVWK